MSLDAGGPLAGGTITVDGLVITVPKNLLVTLPSITVAWPEMFNNGVANLPGSISFEANVNLPWISNTLSLINTGGGKSSWWKVYRGACIHRPTFYANSSRFCNLHRYCYWPFSNQQRH